MNRVPCFLIVVIAAVLRFTEPASAHEFWIESSPFHPELGSVVRVALWHGERFAGDAVRRNDSSIEEFVLFGPDGSQPVVGRDGMTTSFVRLQEPGLHVLGYRSRRMVNELPAAKFEAYLEEEGLDEIIVLRDRDGASDEAGREVYSRCAKALLSVGGSGGRDRYLGYPLELVAERDPATLAPGDELSLRLLYRGEPLGGAVVVAVNRQEPQRLFSARSDDEGLVRFSLASDGVWMFTSIHMVRAPADVEADWESFWSSLTLEVRNPAEAVENRE